MSDSESDSCASSSVIFQRAQSIIDDLGNRVTELDAQLAKLRAFRQRIAPLDSFTPEEKTALEALIEARCAERDQNVVEMERKMQVYDEQIATVHRHLEERTQILEDDDVSALLESNDKLMDLVVGNQAELTLRLQASSQMIEDGA